VDAGFGTPESAQRGKRIGIARQAQHVEHRLVDGMVGGVGGQSPVVVRDCEVFPTPLFRHLRVDVVMLCGADKHGDLATTQRGDRLPLVIAPPVAGGGD